MKLEIEVWTLAECYDSGAPSVSVFPTRDAALTAAEERIRDQFEGAPHDNPSECRHEIAVMRQRIEGVTGYQLSEDGWLGLSSHTVEVESAT